MRAEDKDDGCQEELDNPDIVLDFWKTRISGSYGPLKSVAPAEILPALLTRKFDSVTSLFINIIIATTASNMNCLLDAKMFVPPPPSCVLEMFVLPPLDISKFGQFYGL